MVEQRNFLQVAGYQQNYEEAISLIAESTNEYQKTRLIKAGFGLDAAQSCVVDVYEE